VTLAAVADARVLQANPTTNYGTLNRLDVDSPGQESYIRFSVTGVTGAVQNATLRLFVTNGSSNGPSLYLTDNSWTETGITWNNRPAPTSGMIADVAAVTAGTWLLLFFPLEEDFPFAIRSGILTLAKNLST
jgi:hypothetical protein